MSRPVLPSQSFQRGLVEDIRFASEALAVAMPRMSKPPGKPLPTRTAFAAEPPYRTRVSPLQMERRGLDRRPVHDPVLPGPAGRGRQPDRAGAELDGRARRPSLPARQSRRSNGRSDAAGAVELVNVRPRFVGIDAAGLACAVGKDDNILWHRTPSPKVRQKPIYITDCVSPTVSWPTCVQRARWSRPPQF